MIRITYSDLPKVIGINPLTGEADAYALRILCDLSLDGQRLVETYLGLPACTPMNKNWNSRVGDAPAVASVLLTHDALWGLAKFFLLYRLDYDVVLQSPDDAALIGLNKADKYYDNYMQLAAEHNYHMVRNLAKLSGAPRIGDRNTHAVSGRTM